MSEIAPERPRDRLSTGVPGLDAVLQGGLLRRGVYMLQGRPGAGKTVLANQICFNHAAAGGRVVYATLLAESHERMFFNLEQFAFFDASRTPEQVSFLSAFAALEEGGLRALAELLRREARARKISLLVVDGLVAVEELAENKQAFKKFIQELQTQANLLDCTILLLTSASAEAVGPEHTMVDGVISVSERRVSTRSERELEIVKLRGGGYLRGTHTFQITNAGIIVYPRLEALLQDPSPVDAAGAERVTTGIAGLDEMLHGGLRCASSTVMLGTTGTGKTVLGLHFLNACSAEAPGLFFGFYETPARILLKAQVLGLDLESKQRAGALELMWQPPTERLLDMLGHKLLAKVRARGVTRLFVDGVDGFIRAASDMDRISHFLSALTNELRLLGVTSLYSLELTTLFGDSVDMPFQGISSLVENIFLLRMHEGQKDIARSLSVVKVRDSAYDHTIRRLEIKSTGAELGAPLDAGMRG
jgi:circadian clock protein KaiC